MNVPLLAHRVIRPGGQYLEIWRNSRRELVKAPFSPYCYTRSPLSDQSDVVDHEEVEVRPLSTLRPESWHRYGFLDVRGVQRVSRGAQRPLTTADDHLPFVDRVLVDLPDYYRGYPNSDPLRVLVLDVEQWTTGRGFPTARDPLISVAWAEDDRPPECVMAEPEVLPDDAPVLEALLEEFRRFDPDVVVGYNINGYDLPMLVARMGACKLNPAGLTRDGGDPVSREGIRLGGRVVYDVFGDSVRFDQTLYGIKDRSLKTVSRWMGFEGVVEADVRDTRGLVGTPELERYNRSDVELTRRLSRVYLPNFLELAEFHGAPLGRVFEATPSFHVSILQGRVFRGLGIVSDGTNEARYPVFYRFGPGESAFEAAIVEIYRRGLFSPLWKVDFASMYPSIMVTLGCGADNTRILGTEPLGGFRVERRGEVRVLHIPDRTRRWNVVVEVEGRSALAGELDRLLRRRLELKELGRQAAHGAQREALRARQNVLKVVLNSIFGVNGSSRGRYGSLPVAVATVGVAREVVRHVEGLLGESKIETDTDGIFCDRPVESAGLQGRVDGFVEGALGVESSLRVEVESYRAGFFHEKKSYLLLHPDGRFERHGVGFLSSARCGVFDLALERVGVALLSGDPRAGELAREVLRVEERPRGAFLMRYRFGKEAGEYVEPNALGAQLARLVAARDGAAPPRGVQVEYVKTTRGYELPGEGVWDRLDMAYYRGMVRELLVRLGVEPGGQRSLGEFSP